nr:hypothetical protein [Rhodococcus sp. DMU1]
MVQRDDEQVVPFEPDQKLLAVSTPGQGVGQFGGNPSYDARVEQEPAQCRILVGQHLFREVVGDRPFVPRKCLHGGLHIVRGPERQGREPQAGRPSLGLGEEGLHLSGFEDDIVVGQKLFRLGGIEPQRFRTDLGQLTAQAESLQWQRRIAASGDHQSHVAEPPADGRRERLHGRRPGEQMHVVQHQDDGMGKAATRIGEHGDEPGVETGWDPHRRQQRTGGEPADGAERVQDPAPELRRFGVLTFHREPCHRPGV